MANKVGKEKKEFYGHFAFFFTANVKLFLPNGLKIGLASCTSKAAPPARVRKTTALLKQQSSIKQVGSYDA